MSENDSNHYFSADPTVRSRRREIDLILSDAYLTLTTDNGVFSMDQVDPGSRYLLQAHPSIPPATSAILDLGCGYGPLALVAAKRAPRAQVWGVDVNERAIELAVLNGSDNDIGNARFGTADSIPLEQTFDLIISNPPIRIGKQALHQLLTTWLDRLRPTGLAWLVVHKHLGSDSLAKWLNAQGWPTTRLSSRSGYRILEVQSKATSL